MTGLFGPGAATTWAALIGSGVFHGINPAMGWLFATALGLQRGSRSALLLALPPMALGHASSIFALTASAALIGTWISHGALHWLLGALLIGWAAYQSWAGHRHRVRVGMTAGFIGLALWSAAMATLHGAGLMLVPALLPLCGGSALGDIGTSLQFTLAHTLITLATTALVALVVYEYVGVGVLKRGWINFDWLWRAALALTGVLVIALG